MPNSSGNDAPPVRNRWGETPPYTGPNATLPPSPGARTTHAMLFFVIHLFVGAVTLGVAIVVALLMGVSSLVPLLIAAGLGFVVSLPVSWVIARKISGD